MARAFIAIKDREPEEDAARMVHPHKGGLRDHGKGTFAAIIRMRAPTDIGQQAGGMAKPALFGAFRQFGNGEELIRPIA